MAHARIQIRGALTAALETTGGLPAGSVDLAYGSPMEDRDGVANRQRTRVRWVSDTEVSTSGAGGQIRELELEVVTAIAGGAAPITDAVEMDAALAAAEALAVKGLRTDPTLAGIVQDVRWLRSEQELDDQGASIRGVLTTTLRLTYCLASQDDIEVL